MKGSPLYTDLRLTGLADGKRGQPSWTIEEYKRNSGEKGKQLTALDLQVRRDTDLIPSQAEHTTSMLELVCFKVLKRVTLVLPMMLVQVIMLVITLVLMLALVLIEPLV